MGKGELLTTRILDAHGKIGPFFFKEFMVAFLVTTALYFFVLLVSSFFPLPAILLVGIPAAFLLLIGFLRLVFIKRIHSPWYIHQWVLHRFLQPHSLIADGLRKSPDTLCFPIGQNQKKA